MIKLNLGLFLSTSAMLFYIIRYRIHVHVEYTPRHRRARAKVRLDWSERRAADKNLGGGLSTVARDLESALMNLGASKKEARERTAVAMAQGPADFDTLIFRAMQAGSRKWRGCLAGRYSL